MDLDVAQEVLRVGPWSVRQGADGLVYVNVERGTTQMEPPKEVLEELGVDDEDDEDRTDVGDEPRPASSAGSASAGGTASAGGFQSTGGGFNSTGGGFNSTRGSSRQASSAEVGENEAQGGGAKFRRILLGVGRDLPLAMARDILSACREDASIFEAARSRFSDVPKEADLDFDKLHEELAGVAAAMAPGEVSEVIGTEAGMQILLRVC